MKAKPLIWIIIILVIIGLAVFFAGGNRNDADTPDDVTDVEDNEVRLISPEARSVVSSPLTVRGEARGSWFFEANIPIEIQDEEGNVLAQTGAQSTTGEWMTTDFVEFEGELEFNVGDAESGFIVVRKDNPSGLPENDDSRKFPIKFGDATEETITFNVYFQAGLAKDTDCSKVTAVERTVPKTQAVGRAAIEALLAGPTAEEMEVPDDAFDEFDTGYSTAIPEGVTLQSLRIEDGTAYADFSEELDRNVGGSCRVIAIWNQINSTLTQFSTVNDVVISINGRTEEILQP